MRGRAGLTEDLTADRHFEQGNIVQSLSASALRKRFVNDNNRNMGILVQHDGEQFGPYSEEEIREFFKQGIFKADDFARSEGMEDWKPLAKVFPNVLGETQPKAGTRKRESRARVVVIAGVASLAVIGGAAWFWTVKQRDRTTQHQNPYDAVLAYSPPSAAPQQPPAKAAVPLGVSAKRESFDLVTLAKKTRSAVVLVEVFDQSNKVIATGSGFFISEDGMLVTNFHVIENAHSIVARAESGAMYQVVGAIAGDQKADLALLKAVAKGMPFLGFRDSEKAEAGEKVAVIGSPLGLEGSVSEGIISAKRTLSTGEQWLQITAPISPGSSGSPVINSTGEVIGVASMLLRDGQALNFAVPSESVWRLVESVSDDNKLQRFPLTAAPDVNYLKAELNAAAKIYGALSKNDLTTAVREGRSFVEQYPQKDKAHYMLGEVYNRAGFTGDAIAQYQESLKLNPSSSGSWEKLGELYLEQHRERDAFAAYLQVATLCEEELQAEKKQFEDFERQLPESPVKKGYALTKSKTLSQLSQAYQKTNRPAKAKQAYQESTQLWDKNTDAWKGLGYMSAESGDEEAALAAYRHVMLDGNSEAAAWEQLSFYYESKKRDSDTARCWLKAESLRKAH